MRDRKQTIVVTGASRGVGLDLCRYFDMKGWRVIGLARRVSALKEGDVKFIKADGSTLDFYNVIAYEVGEVDILINNAGMFFSGPLVEENNDSVDRIIDTNLKGTIYATMACLKVMKPGARIINISSVAALHGIKHQSLYSASKAGINGFFESLQHELLPKGILLSTINPGGIDSTLWNADNPYQGGKGALLQTGDIVSLVDYISELPPNVVFKNATIYPINERH